MAEETVDTAVEVCGLEPAGDCNTKHLLLDGAQTWTPTLFIRLIQDFGLDSHVRGIKLNMQNRNETCTKS